MSWEQRLIAYMVAPPGAGALPRPADWAAIDHAARAHRLRPLLHARAAAIDDAPPPAMRRAWAIDYLREQQHGAAIARSVAQIAALLTGADVPHAFLKGVHLAWDTYPDPAQRAMRDIDLLINPDAVIAARDRLLAAGYLPAPFGQKTDDYAMTQAKHLAPLIAPGTGVTVELHHMLTDPAAELGTTIRFDETPALLARVQHIDVGGMPVAVLPNDELLLHILYHAVYDHFFSNGPQVIADACFLVQRHDIHWPRFWAKAESRSMAAGVGLVLGICARTAQLPIEIPLAWRPGDAAMMHAMTVMMRDNYADRVARSVSDLARSRAPRAILSAVRSKFTNQAVIAQNNAHLAAAATPSPVQRSRWSAVGDVLRHVMHQQRHDTALRKLLKDR